MAGSGNVSTPVVDGAPQPSALSDGGLQAEPIVAGLETEEVAEAESIGQVGQQERTPARATRARATAQAAAGEQPESVAEPAPADVTPDEAAAEHEPTLAELQAELKAVREENRKVQAQKDREAAQRLAREHAAEQQREQYEREVARYRAEMAQYQKYLDGIEAERQEARRRADEAELERQLAAAPPEVRAAYQIAIKHIQETEQRRTTDAHNAAVDRMNRLMIEGIPGEAFAGLPQDRPLTPVLVDAAAQRWLDWQYMQETTSRVSFTDVWKAVKSRHAAAKAKQPTTPARPTAPAPPQAPKPVAQPVRVAPSTAGRPPSSLERLMFAAIDQGDTQRAEKLRKQLGVQYGESVS